MNYEILDDITFADIAFRAHGSDLKELFIFSAEALIAIMIQNPQSIEDKIKKTVKLQNSNLEILLSDYLTEFLFFKDSDSLLLMPESIVISRNNEIYYLTGELMGETINHEKHEIAVDIKAVTMHNLKVEFTKNAWSSTVVVDV